MDDELHDERARTPHRPFVPLVALGLVLFWLAVGVLVGIFASISDAVAGEDVLFGRAFRMYFVAALVWIPASPLPWLAAGRFPIRRDTWTRSVPLHLGASVVFAVVVHLAILLLQRAVGLHTTGLADTMRLGFSTLGRNLHLIVLVYWVIVGGRHGWTIRGRARARGLEAARLEAQLNRATLETLRLQLRPHFLFNALHTVNLLWRTGRDAEAQETLERLSALLRGLLDEAVPQRVRLHRELELARDYLAIERVRFGDRLTVDVRVDDDVLDALVPSFLLQPLIENAITHGIEPRAEAGRIAIAAKRAGDELVIEVRDDGAGADASALGAGEGIGLGNTRRRLEGLYGEEARLEVVPLPERGTVIRIVVPLVRADEPGDAAAEVPRASPGGAPGGSR